MVKKKKEVKGKEVIEGVLKKLGLIYEKEVKDEGETIYQIQVPKVESRVGEIVYKVDILNSLSIRKGVLVLGEIDIVDKMMLYKVLKLYKKSLTE